MSTLKVNAIRQTTATSDAVTLAADGTCTIKATNKSNRNLIINGAMNVAQRGTSSTSGGYQTVDRFTNSRGGMDEAITQAQHALTSSDTGPWEKGFRYSYHLTNGNQTSGAGAGDYAQVAYTIEAQDVVHSGWNYTDSNSKLTLQFWAKSSVAKTFILTLYTQDGTDYTYNHKYALAANTWTKITHTFPGNSNLTFDNDHGIGIQFMWKQFIGTTYTSGSTVDQWVTYGGYTSTPDDTSDWWTTNDATFELTGVQLEVGDTATDFEHRSYGDELARCERYFQKIDYQVGSGSSGLKPYYYSNIPFKTEMRDGPSLIEASGYKSDSGNFVTYVDGDYTTQTNGCNLDDASTSQVTIHGGSGSTYHWIKGRVHLAAEL